MNNSVVDLEAFNFMARRSTSEDSTDIILRVLAWVNLVICAVAIAANCTALHFLNGLRKLEGSFKATNYIFACITFFDLIRGCTGFEFYFMFFYFESQGKENILLRWCPYFSFLECLSSITLSIALLLAFTKAIVLLATFMVKRYINNRNILVALASIIISKVLYTGVRIFKSGVRLNHFSVSCDINDHYRLYQIWISFVLNYEFILILLLLATALIIISYYIMQKDITAANGPAHTRGDQDGMLFCALSILATSIICYSIFIGFRFVNIYRITVSRTFFFNYRYFKACSETLLLNLNSAANPFLYILHNRSIKRKLDRNRLRREKMNPRCYVNANNSVVLDRLTSLRQQNI